jgi:hypothetical protein
MPIPIPSPWRGGGLNWLVQRFSNLGPPNLLFSVLTHRDRWLRIVTTNNPEPWSLNPEPPEAL